MKELTVSASEFKAKRLRMLDDVAANGVPVLITKRGLPIARLVPLGGPLESLEGAWKGLDEIKGDIVRFDASADWEVLGGGHETRITNHETRLLRGA